MNLKKIWETGWCRPAERKMIFNFEINKVDFIRINEYKMIDNLVYRKKNIKGVIMLLFNDSWVY